MKVSVVIPAFAAEATLERALESLVLQSYPDWEAIIVSDDGVDYQQFLSGKGIADQRLHFGTTGQTHSGCHAARNAGFPLVSGDFVTQLDADDTLAPDRFETLLPLAARYGAAADNLLMVDEVTGKAISTTIKDLSDPVFLALAEFMSLNAPLVPLIRRDHMLPRVPGVEFSEDAIANIQLIDRIGQLPVTVTSSYFYHLRSGSVANSEKSSTLFETGYSDYINRLETGDGFGLSAENRIIACGGLNAKRALNRAFMKAQSGEPELSFQEFVGRQ
jgi:glycosyltransferase involved in cell wall biosynthesis